MMNMLGINSKMKTEDDLLQLSEDDGDCLGGHKDIEVMTKLVEDLKEQ